MVVEQSNRWCCSRRKRTCDFEMLTPTSLWSSLWSYPLGAKSKLRCKFIRHSYRNFLQINACTLVIFTEKIVSFFLSRSLLYSSLLDTYKPMARNTYTQESWYVWMVSLFSVCFSVSAIKEQLFAPEHMRSTNKNQMVGVCKRRWACGVEVQLGQARKTWATYKQQTTSYNTRPLSY